MSTNEGRPVRGKEEMQALQKELWLEVFLLRIVLRLFRRKLGKTDSWKRTHGISFLQWSVFTSQNAMCGMWGWADFPRPGTEVPILHSASYSHVMFHRRNFDVGLGRTLNDVHRQLAPEIMEQLELVQKNRDEMFWS